MSSTRFGQRPDSDLSTLSKQPTKKVTGTRCQEHVYNRWQVPKNLARDRSHTAINQITASLTPHSQQNGITCSSHDLDPANRSFVMQFSYFLIGLATTAMAWDPKKPGCVHQKTCLAGGIGYCSDGKGKCRPPDADHNGDHWCDCDFPHIHCAPVFGLGCTCQGGLINCPPGVKETPELPPYVSFRAL